MPSALRTNIYNAIATRLSNLGHIMSPGDLYALCDDIETQVAADASATADAQSDIGQFPDPPPQE